MKKSTFSLIAVLYDNQNAGLYNDVYFPIIKYTIVTLFYQKDRKEYYSVDDVSNYINQNFGLTIPVVVLKKTIVHISKVDNNFDLDVYEKGEEFKIKKAWDFKVNQEIEEKILHFEDQVNLLEEEYSKYLNTHNFVKDKTFIDFISDNTDDVLDYLKDKNVLKVDEKYTSIAFFLEHLKNKGDRLFEVASDMFWGSVIAGFLNRDEQEIKESGEIGKTEYFFDTSLVLGLLKLSSQTIERYAFDLYQSLKKSKVVMRIHPVTIYEINSILLSVERNGAFPNTDISFAVSTYNYKKSDIASMRANLVERLDKMSISLFPNVDANFISNITSRYKDKSIIKRLASSRGDSLGEHDNFREIHDVYMHDYILERRGKLLNFDKCSFVTLNKDLIDFYKKEDTANKHVFIHPYKLTMELWMSGCSSSDLKVAALTESISRCFFLNNVDIRNKIEALSRFYNESSPDYSKNTFDTILLGLFSRDRDLLRYLDEYQENNQKAEFGKAEELKQKIIERGNELNTKHIVQMDEMQDNLNEVVRNSQMLRESFEQKLIEHTEEIKNVRKQNLESSVRIGQLQAENEEVKKSIEATKENIKSLLKKKQKVKLALEKIDKDIDEMTTKMSNSISYCDYWFMIIVVFLFILFTIISILLVIFDENKISVPNIIAYVLTALTALFGLLKFRGEIFHPIVYKYEIKKRQEEYWIANHVEYQEALGKCSELQGELKEIENELERLLG